MAAREHLPEILRISNAVIRTSPANFHLEEESLEDLMSQFEATKQYYPWLVATQDHEITGFAKAGPYRTRAAYDRTAETTIYLDAAQRGQGLGLGLYETLLAVLELQGFRSAIGGITRPNEASEALHQKLGFEPAGVIKDAGWKFGRWWDVAFWQKRFDGAPPTSDDLRRDMLSPQKAWAIFKDLA